MVADLSGPDLNRAIAEQLGWRFKKVPDHFYRLDDPMRAEHYARVSENGEEWVWSRSGFTYAPDFERSLDAQRDGPWKMLHEAGWAMVIESGTGRWFATWYTPHQPHDFLRGRQYGGVGDTPAVACARATLAALLAMNGGTTRSP